MVKHSGEMVKAAIKAKNMTQAELARKIGRDQTLISRYLSGQIEISDKAARSIAEALEMDFEELHHQLQRDRLVRRREKFEAEFKDVVDEEKKTDDEQVYEVGYVGLMEFVIIPMLDSVPVSAHGWSAKGSKRYALPPDVQVDAERSFAVRVSGKNMADDKVDEGDLIVVDSGAKAHDGDVVLAIVKGEPLLRRIYRTGNTTVLQASGDCSEPVVFLSRKDDFEIVGKLVLCVKFFGY
ncbi:LexA family transcriptional regulator [Candidatus Poribacteria bacterium]